MGSFYYFSSNVLSCSLLHKVGSRETYGSASLTTPSLTPTTSDFIVNNFNNYYLQYANNNTIIREGGKRSESVGFPTLQSFTANRIHQSIHKIRNEKGSRRAQDGEVKIHSLALLQARDNSSN